jgi:hypothetical protein
MNEIRRLRRLTPGERLSPETPIARVDEGVPRDVYHARRLAAPRLAARRGAGRPAGARRYSSIPFTFPSARRRSMIFWARGGGTGSKWECVMVK